MRLIHFLCFYSKHSLVAAAFTDPQSPNSSINCYRRATPALPPLPHLCWHRGPNPPSPSRRASPPLKTHGLPRTCGLPPLASIERHRVYKINLMMVTPVYIKVK